MEYIKYLPLLQLGAKYPDVIDLVNKTLALWQPHIVRLEQFITDAELLVRQIEGPKQ